MIHEFDVEQNLSCHCMVCSPDLAEVDQCVDGSEKGAIEPTPPLRYELRYISCKRM